MHILLPLLPAHYCERPHSFLQGFLSPRYNQLTVRHGQYPLARHELLGSLATQQAVAGLRLIMMEISICLTRLYRRSWEEAFIAVKPECRCIKITSVKTKKQVIGDSQSWLLEPVHLYSSCGCHRVSL